MVRREAQFERFGHFAQVLFSDSSTVRQILKQTGIEDDAIAAFAWNIIGEVFIKLMRDVFLRHLRILNGGFEGYCADFMQHDIGLKVTAGSFYDGLGDLLMFIERHAEAEVYRPVRAAKVKSLVNLHCAEAAALHDLNNMMVNCGCFDDISKLWVGKPQWH